jgi:hypothetical protein
VTRVNYLVNTLLRKVVGGICNREPSNVSVQVLVWEGIVVEGFECLSDSQPGNLRLNS